jgi:flagellar motor switch protein FliN/FliY
MDSMAGESDIIGQAEIEALLQQARGAAQQPIASSTPVPLGAVRQDEIDSLLAGGGRAAPTTGPATATASPPPRVAPAPKSSQSAGDDIQYLLDQAEAAIASVNQPNPTPPGLSPFPLADLAGSPASQEKATLDLLRDVELDLKIELGRTNMYLEDVLKLKRGSVVTLDKLAGDPVDVYVNGRLIARGEVLVLNDNFCVRVAELVSGDDVK